MSVELFRGIVPFVAAADAGTFRAAGTRLGVSAAAISKAIAALEADSGVTLFARSGRRVSLTREGRIFLEHCAPAVHGVAAGRAALAASRRQPDGELVVTVPFVAVPLLIPAVGRLRERHPRLTFALRVTDRVVRLAEEGVAAAVRIGTFPSSGLIARRVRRTALWTVVSPLYVARAGAPQRVEDLDEHAVISAVSPRGKPFPWVFDDGPRTLRPLLTTDFAPALVDAALAGLGITQLFDFMAEPLVRGGRLLRVLGERTGAGPDVVVACEPGQRSSPRVTALMRALEEESVAR